MTVTIDTVDVPVAATERIDVLDVLRGVAVLGILLVNIDSFLGYGMAPPVGTPPGARYDRIAAFLVEFLVQGKFYCLFSFLFGVGFAVFIARATARGRDAVALFKRRLVALLLIGSVHTFLIWYGDILTNYAVIGFALIPFLRRDDRAVLRAAFIGAAMGDSGSPRLPSASGLVEMAVETIATPALALAYAAAICLMYRSARTLMLVVAPVGRMALSSYLTHSVAGVLAFYGMGLGDYGQVSLTVGLALCFVMFAVQIVASRLWLSMAAFGPAEWLWRCITYRRSFALLRATAPPSPR